MQSSSGLPCGQVFGASASLGASSLIVYPLGHAVRIFALVLEHLVRASIERLYRLLDGPLP